MEPTENNQINKTVTDEKDVNLPEQPAGENPSNAEVPKKKHPLVNALETVGLLLLVAGGLYVRHYFDSQDKKEEQVKFQQQMEQSMAYAQADQINNELFTLQTTHQQLDKDYALMIKSVNGQAMTDPEVMAYPFIGGRGLTEKQKLEYLKASYQKLSDSYNDIDKKISEMGGERPEGLAMNKQAAKTNAENLATVLSHYTGL